MTKVVIAGAAGRMGYALIRCAQADPSFSIVGATEAEDHPSLGQDAGTLAGIGAIDVPLTSDIDACLLDSDVVIDFTFHTAVPGNVRSAFKHRRAVVIGTTAITEEEAQEIFKASNEIPIIMAPNMSLGVNLLFAAVKQAGAVLQGYTVDIDETHHIHKKDAPSGTALGLGENVAEGMGSDLNKIMKHVEEDAPAERSEGEILIRSHREGEVFGDHSVVFENSGERISFTHNLKNRDALALGALKAAEWVVTRRPRLYDMQDVLGLR